MLPALPKGGDVRAASPVRGVGDPDLPDTSKAGACMPEDAENDRTPDHQEAPTSDTRQDAAEDLWRIVSGAIHLGGLYLEYRQNEGAALTAQALVLLIHLCRAQS